MPLAVGDRVRRPRNVGVLDNTFRLGVITEVYLEKAGSQSTPRRLFAVQWDETGTIERGYLEWGLERIMEV